MRHINIPICEFLATHFLPFILTLNFFISHTFTQRGSKCCTCIKTIYSSLAGGLICNEIILIAQSSTKYFIILPPILQSLNNIIEDTSLTLSHICCMPLVIRGRLCGRRQERLKPQPRNFYSEIILFRRSSPSFDPFELRFKGNDDEDDGAGIRRPKLEVG